jgi:hypothetical protein
LGIISGGTTVQITGSNFSAGTTAVQFGGMNASSFTVISDTAISAVVPAHAIGSVSVDVTAGGSTNAANTLFTYTTDNQNVQVTVTVTVPGQADIRWGAATTADDSGAARAGTIAPYTWILKDSEFGAANQVNLGATYATNDAGYPHTLTIANVSKTDSTIKLDAQCTDAYSGTGIAWTAGNPAGTDVFLLTAQLGASAVVPISPGPATLNPLVANFLLKGIDQNLVLQLTTPSAVTNLATVGATQTVIMTLIATAN